VPFFCDGEGSLTTQTFSITEAHFRGAALLLLLEAALLHWTEWDATLRVNELGGERLSGERCRRALFDLGKHVEWVLQARALFFTRLSTL
jgi:hypothetical protein